MEKGGPENAQEEGKFGVSHRSKQGRLPLRMGKESKTYLGREDKNRFLLKNEDIQGDVGIWALTEHICDADVALGAKCFSNQFA